MVRILICRTCPRYEPRRPDTVTRGAALARHGKARGESLEGISVMAVNCLAGCRNPCNAAIDAPDLVRLRFSRLEEADLDHLFEVAALYKTNSEEDMADDALPETLRDKLTARSPARVDRQGE